MVLCIMAKVYYITYATIVMLFLFNFFTDWLLFYNYLINFIL